MKNAITILTFIFLLSRVWGQGTVNFKNFGPGLNAPVTGPKSDASGIELLSGAEGWVADLWYGPLGSTEARLIPLRQPTPFLTGVLAGYFNGGTRTIPGIPAGSVATLQVRAWNLQDGETWEDATCCPWVHAGRSGTFNVTLTSPPATPVLLIGLQSFTCLSIYPWWQPPIWFNQQPESQTVALGDTVTFAVQAGGYVSFTYQWFFGYNPIPNATNSTCTITNVQYVNQGNYSVRLPSCCGVYPSSTATLTVLGEPQFTMLPETQTAEASSSVRLRAAARGVSPMAYQWLFNGSPLAEATSTALPLTNLDFTDAGAYQLVATNTFGSATSAPAFLSVINPVPRQWVPGIVVAGSNAVNLDSAPELATPPGWSYLATTAPWNGSQWFFESPSLPQRVYRGWQTNPPGPVPTLAIHLVPELFLTGSIGSTNRIEAINKIGPTGAWFTVSEVVITNSAQVYRDTSAVGQPPRLWRVTPLSQPTPAGSGDSL